MQALTLLVACPLFAGVHPAALARLAAQGTPLPLAGGQTLFYAGAEADCLYIVATGRLRAVYADGRVAGDIARLEPIGEIGLLTGEPRGATVHALRSSLLFKFSRRAFAQFAAEEPLALMAITKVIISRLREPTREARLRSARNTRTLAVLSATKRCTASEFSRWLTTALGPKALCIDAAKLGSEIGPAEGFAEAPLREWMGRIEFDTPHIVYDASGPEGWRQLALRQADRVLVVVDAREAPDLGFAQQLLKVGLRTPIELVLLRANGDSSPHTQAWKTALAAAEHYYVRPHDTADVASLARQLIGHGVGVVLGGGGARGFAHVGMLRALHEAGIAVDVAGGASMGAFVSALHASGRSTSEIAQVLHQTFVEHNVLNDYTLPRLSIISGKKFRKHMHSLFGDLRIEQMPTPWFCVSTNLSKGSAMVHREGSVADWLAASMCIPGFAPPVAYLGDLLCDGAVINSLPTDVMQDLGRGLIVASDVSTEGAIAAPSAIGPDPDFEAVQKPGPDGHRVNLVDVLFRTTSLTSESGTKARAERADLYLRMPVGIYKTFDWQHITAIIDKGYRHTLANLPALKARIAADGVARGLIETLT